MTTRISNPLNPTYTARDENGNLVEIGEIKGSKPTELPKQKKDPNLQPSASLLTQDIDGAQAGSKFKQGIFADSFNRREYRETNKTEDIEGANAGSLKKSPTTKRVSNPLDPNYSLPGQSDLQDKFNPYSSKKQNSNNQQRQLSI